MLNKQHRIKKAKIYWMALAAGLFFLAGCEAITSPFGSSGPSYPDWLLGSSNLPNGTEFTLDVPEQVAKGEPVPLKLTIRNTTNSDLELRYREHRMNFAIGNGDSSELVWSLDMLSPVILLHVSPVITLKVGEEINYEVEWDQSFGEYKNKYEPGSKEHRRNDDEVGKQVQAGTYKIYGQLYFGIRGAGNEQDYHTRPYTLTIEE